MNNAVFRKTMGNVRKLRDNNLVTTTATKKKLFSDRTKPSYHKIVFRQSFSNRNDKNKTKNKWTSLFRFFDSRN